MQPSRLRVLLRTVIRWPGNEENAEPKAGKLAVGTRQVRVDDARTRDPRAATAVRVGVVLAVAAAAGRADYCRLGTTSGHWHCRCILQHNSLKYTNVTQTSVPDNDSFSDTRYSCRLIL